MYQAAVFPSDDSINHLLIFKIIYQLVINMFNLPLTDSTVVFATPAKSPPQNTCGNDVWYVVKLTFGKLHSLSWIGDRASKTVFLKEMKCWRVTLVQMLIDLDWILKKWKYLPSFSLKTEPKAEMIKFALSLVIWSWSSTHAPSSFCSFRHNSIDSILT